MKRRKVTVAVLSVVLAAAALTGCGSAQQTNGPKKTRVVLNEVAHSLFYAPMYVAIEEGYFEDAGIDLELVTGFGADKTMTAVLTGGGRHRLYGQREHHIHLCRRNGRLCGELCPTDPAGGKFPGGQRTHR